LIENSVSYAVNKRGDNDGIFILLANKDGRSCRKQKGGYLEIDISVLYRQCSILPDSSTLL